MKVSHRYNQNFALIKVVMVDDGVGKFRDQAASDTFTQLLIGARKFNDARHRSKHFSSKALTQARQFRFIEGNRIIKLSLG